MPKLFLTFHSNPVGTNAVTFYPLLPFEGQLGNHGGHPIKGLMGPISRGVLGEIDSRACFGQILLLFGVSRCPAYEIRIESGGMMESTGTSRSAIVMILFLLGTTNKALESLEKIILFYPENKNALALMERIKADTR